MKYPNANLYPPDARTIPVARSADPLVKYHVTGKAWLDSVCDVSEHAINTLIQTCTTESDTWTPEGMKKYLQFTWLRLLEQERVVLVKNPSKERNDDENTFGDIGLSQKFCVFRTGLFDHAGRSVICVFVQM
eukprot:ANDGO_01305.mRNA.1 hypothetical protein